MELLLALAVSAPEESVSFCKLTDVAAWGESQTSNESSAQITDDVTWTGCRQEQFSMASSM